MNRSNQWLFESPFSLEDFDAAPLAGGYQNLVTASAKPELSGIGGNYVIRWNKTCTLPGRYVGETENLQDRLQHHVQHIRRFGLDPSKYQVLITNKQVRPKTQKSHKSRITRQQIAIRNAHRRRSFATNLKSKESEYLFETL
jgi:hypothetical protein